MKQTKKDTDKSTIHPETTKTETAQTEKNGTTIENSYQNTRNNNEVILSIPSGPLRDDVSVLTEDIFSKSAPSSQPCDRMKIILNNLIVVDAEPPKVIPKEVEELPIVLGTLVDDEMSKM
jgi:hypothetical protein